MKIHGLDTENWERIVVDSDYDVWKKCHWCGGDPGWMVTRTSKVTGGTYTDPCCSFHAKKWLGSEAHYLLQAACGSEPGKGERK